uniref:MARVEL domain-containing protein n=1 Tax=Parastrongyloides trichosuri TaxID=131310 RepID=A0A0N4ZNZ3_PARTI
MGANPCCCRLKDGSISIAIWSFIFSIVQLGIFGWQLAAIKYEKDRAANNLLPNYNTYGRFDIPSYYESYWQSPEERYYIGLFVCQIICAIISFFLLFASVALIYGIHTLSRYLIWPWFPCMLLSILSSLAYCITWWAGDVREYWVVLTIIEIFGVVINLYCFVVIIAFYHRIGKERKVYEKRMLPIENDAFCYPAVKNEYKVPPKKHPYDIDAIEPEIYNEGKKKQYYYDDSYKNPTKMGDVYEDSVIYDQGNNKVLYKNKYRTNKDLEKSRLLEWVKSTTDLTSITINNKMPKGQHQNDHGYDFERRPSRLSHYPQQYKNFEEYNDDLPASAEASTMKSLHDDDYNHRHKCKKHECCRKKHKHRRHKKCRRKHRYSCEINDCHRFPDDESESHSPSFQTELTSVHGYKERKIDEDDHCHHSRRSRSNHKPTHRSCTKYRSLPRKCQSDEEDSKSNNNNYPTLSLADLEKGFTIPQRIIIPPNPPPGPDGKVIPQTYHINSEITISYDEYGKPRLNNSYIDNSVKESKHEKNHPAGVISDV